MGYAGIRPGCGWSFLLVDYFVYVSQYVFLFIETIRLSEGGNFTTAKHGRDASCPDALCYSVADTTAGIVRATRPAKLSFLRSDPCFIRSKAWLRSAAPAERPVRGP